MVTTTQIAPHEALELHELIRSEVTCANKMKASIGLIQDSELKNFMEHSLDNKKTILNQYQQFYIKSQNIQ